MEGGGWRQVGEAGSNLGGSSTRKQAKQQPTLATKGEQLEGTTAVSVCVRNNKVQSFIENSHKQWIFFLSSDIMYQ